MDNQKDMAYTKDHILVSGSITNWGLMFPYQDMRSGVKDRRDWTEDELHKAKDEVRPMEVNEVEKDGQQSLEIYFPSYDVNRSMASGYTGLKIILPEGVDIAPCKDSFIKKLSEKFYSLDLFMPKGENRDCQKIAERARDLFLYAKQLLADQISQACK